MSNALQFTLGIALTTIPCAWTLAVVMVGNALKPKGTGKECPEKVVLLAIWKLTLVITLGVESIAWGVRFMLCPTN